MPPSESYQSPGVPEPTEADLRRARAWIDEQGETPAPTHAVATLIAAVRIEAIRDALAWEHTTNDDLQAHAVERDRPAEATGSGHAYEAWADAAREVIQMRSDKATPHAWERSPDCTASDSWPCREGLVCAACSRWNDRRTNEDQAHELRTPGTAASDTMRRESDPIHTCPDGRPYWAECAACMLIFDRVHPPARQRPSEGPIVHESDGKLRPMCGADMNRGDSVVRRREDVTCPQCTADRLVAENTPPPGERRPIERRSAEATDPCREATVGVTCAKGTLGCNVIHRPAEAPPRSMSDLIRESGAEQIGPLEPGDIVTPKSHAEGSDFIGVVKGVMSKSVANPYSVEWMNGETGIGFERGQLIFLMRPRRERATPTAEERRPPLTHVAIRFKGTVYSLPAPFRHHHIFSIMHYLGIEGPYDANGEDQGFLDASGRYLNRKQALPSAWLHNQIKNDGKLIAPSVLTSEDLW